MGDVELARRVVEQPGWRWVPGMADHEGNRVLDPATVGAESLPDLDDWATAGAILGIIASYDALTDVVRDGTDWIVAVAIGGDISGYAADTLGEAAVWALMAVWENLPEMPMA